MPDYVGPKTSDDYRASTQECLDRAQRALEVAELNLDTLSTLLNRQLVVNADDLIAHAEARTRLGGTWADLATAKALVEP